VTLLGPPGKHVLIPSLLRPPRAEMGLQPTPLQEHISFEDRVANTSAREALIASLPKLICLEQEESICFTMTFGK
jgi:hypothetical protein